MKRITILIIFAFISSFTNAQITVFEYDGSEVAYNLSSLCHPGKVNIFIYSTHTCGPCKLIKNELIKYYKENQYVILHQINLTKNRYDRDYDKRPVSLMLGYLDGITYTPTILIFNQMGNRVKKINGGDYISEAKLTINKLLESNKYYKTSFVFYKKTEKQQNRIIVRYDTLYYSDTLKFYSTDSNSIHILTDSIVKLNTMLEVIKKNNTVIDSLIHENRTYWIKRRYRISFYRNLNEIKSKLNAVN